MTPHELNLHLIEYGNRMQRDNKEGITTAYLTAYWQRVKRMPDLNNLLEDNKPKAKAEQSPEHMLAMVKQAHSANGGTTI